jgi:SnoaL-like polyketide cyclase
MPQHGVRENSRPTQKGVVMDTATRTEHLLALMTNGDDLFNARDWIALEVVHHPQMIAHVTGMAEPIYGREAHAAAMQQLALSFPDIRVHTPYPVQFGRGDWISVITNVTGTFTGEMALPDGNVIAPTGKAFDLEFAQTSKWDGDQLVVISAFWDSALQAKQLGLA